MNRSKSVVETAERLVASEAVKYSMEREIVCQEAKARQYATRWRIVGAGLAAIVGVCALVSTPDTGTISVRWIVGCACAYLFGFIVGDVIYRKRRPW